MTKRELLKRIEALEKRVAELEARPPWPLCVPWCQPSGTGDPPPEPPYRITC